jgi:hypothetical protein
MFNYLNSVNTGIQGQNENPLYRQANSFPEEKKKMTAKGQITKIWKFYFDIKNTH